MKSAGELILYKDFSGTDEEIFYPMASIIERSRRGGMDAKEERQKFYECFHQLMEVSASHGFQGNLWHNYLTYLLISNENAYSRACEIRGNIEGSINEIALHDFEVFRYFFEFDLEDLGRKLGVDCIPVLLHYERFEGNGKVFNSRIRDRICDLSVRLEQTENVSEFKDCVTEFYRDFGVGKLGLHKAFRVEHHENGAGIVPITNIAHVHLDDLVGYELAKKKLVENTEAFVEGRAANNCLLFGDAGTGKSSSIKAIINQYYDKGLRMIEIYKHQFGDLQSVIAQIKNRNYKFIIYMDDLSFEEFEIEYKYLKAVIEGGLEKTAECFDLCNFKPQTSDPREFQRQRRSQRGYAYFRYGTGKTFLSIPFWRIHLFWCTKQKRISGDCESSSREAWNQHAAGGTPFRSQ